jgi:hypothetical protein
MRTCGESDSDAHHRRKLCPSESFDEERPVAYIARDRGHLGYPGDAAATNRLRNDFT